MTAPDLTPQAAAVILATARRALDGAPAEWWADDDLRSQAEQLAHQLETGLACRQPVHLRDNGHAMSP